jgi:hypothetical protein
MHRVSEASLSYFEDVPEVAEVEMEHHTPTLFEIIQKTSDIYLGALQDRPIPFSSPINWKSTKAICRVGPLSWNIYLGSFGGLCCC